MAQVRKGAMWCGALTLGWMLACWIAACLQCVPLVKTWNPWVEGQCINLFLTQLCISVPSIIVDIAILALPIPHVLKLQLSAWQKYLVIGTFMLGSYVVFTSCYRFRIFLEYTTNDVPCTLSHSETTKFVANKKSNRLNRRWTRLEHHRAQQRHCLGLLAHFGKSTHPGSLNIHRHLLTNPQGPIVRLGIKAFGSVADATGLSGYAKSSSRTGNGMSTDPHASGRSRGKSWSKLGEAGGSRNNEAKGPVHTIGSQPVRPGQPRDSDSDMELHIMRDVAAPSQVAYR